MPFPHSQTDQEYASKYLTYRPWDKHGEHEADIKIFVPPTFSFWPEHVDWRQKGAISAVKDQASSQ